MTKNNTVKLSLTILMKILIVHLAIDLYLIPRFYVSKLQNENGQNSFIAAQGSLCLNLSLLIRYLMKQ